MECPTCEQELNYHDYYFSGRQESRCGNSGNGLHYPASDYKKLGDIYKCENEECESFEESFYTKLPSDELIEGYPC